MRTTGLTLVVLMAAILLTARVHHRQCDICLVQEYERAVLGQPIERWSEREYDEWRTLALYSRMCGVHRHQFRPLSTCGLLTGCRNANTVLTSFDDDGIHCELGAVSRAVVQEVR